MPSDVHLEVDSARREHAPAEQEQKVARDDDGEAGPRQAPVGDEQDDGGVDHQPVGERIGDLAEARLDAPAAGEEPVDLVGDARDSEDVPAGQLCASPAFTIRTTKTGMSASRASVSAFGSCASGAGTARVAIPRQVYGRGASGAADGSRPVQYGRPLQVGRTGPPRR